LADGVKNGVNGVLLVLQMQLYIRFLIIRLIEMKNPEMFVFGGEVVVLDQTMVFNKKESKPCPGSRYTEVHDCIARSQSGRWYKFENSIRYDQVKRSMVNDVINACQIPWTTAAYWLEDQGFSDRDFPLDLYDFIKQRRQ
jgi:hypothetical protein